MNKYTSVFVFIVLLFLLLSYQVSGGTNLGELSWISNLLMEHQPEEIYQSWKTDCSFISYQQSSQKFQQTFVCLNHWTF